MKGIILAGGKGTRLYPMTTTVPKPLLPVYDKPLIYHPMSLLIKAGIKDVLVIVPPYLQEPFENLFGDGSRLGMNICYKQQMVQRGIADAFIVGKDFIGDDDVCLMLADNIFIGSDNELTFTPDDKMDGATVFGYYVDNPKPFGVVEFDKDGNVLSIEEKPQNPKSNYIVPGMYFYDNDVVKIAENVKPSARGELEITSVNEEYLKRKKLKVITIEKDVQWFDAGTPDNLLNSAFAVKEYQNRSGEILACIEEDAYKAGFINREKLIEISQSLSKVDYGKYIRMSADK